MKKYFILLACLTVISCKNVQEEECCPENSLVDSVAVEAPADISDSDLTVTRITQTLQESEHIEEDIIHVVKDRATLKSENKKLATELKTTKDSLQKVVYELKETILKLPKKRNFLQRVLGTGKDSIEVVVIDTIK